MLKPEITKEEFGVLNDDQKKYYVANTEGDKYNADMNKILAAAEEAREHKDRAIQSKIAKDTLVADLTKEKEDALKEKGDFEGLYNIEVARGLEKDTTITDLTGKLDNVGVADALKASKSAIMAELVEGGKNVGLESYLEKRIKTVKVGETVHTVVTDIFGKDTTTTVDELKKEILEMPDFQSVLKGRGSSGGGAGGGGGLGSSDKYEAAFNPATRDVAVQKELLAKDPALFKKLQDKSLANRKRS